MDHTLFHEVGDLLFGPMFRRRLANKLNVNEKTVGRWEKDISEIPENLPNELAAICREQAEKLRKMADKLERLGK